LTAVFIDGLYRNTTAVKDRIDLTHGVADPARTDKAIIFASRTSKMTKLRLSTLIACMIMLFLAFGSSLYMPIVYRLKGLETVNSVSKKIRNKVLANIKPNLEKIGLTDFPKKIILVALKDEQLLEIYAKTASGFALLKQYPFTATSGELGPKLQRGDGQIPEGIYAVESLNPNSTFHLSLKLNYPNEFDRSKSTLSNNADLGNDIFIHGNAITIGCIPIGDQAIEEVFILANHALSYGIKVIISPRDFRTNAEFPTIESVTWENELYELIKKELLKLP
jgi:murein L,D-transpeptidase YafK